MPGDTYYDGDKDGQKIKLDFLSNKLEKKWHQDVVNAKLGVFLPRVVSPDHEQLLVIAGHGLKLYMVAYRSLGEKQWSYWESGSNLAPAAGYLVAGQSGKLLLLQEARDETEKYLSTASVCNRVRILGF